MKNSKAKGFTIVEVLFVLAIGGLILMMVFLAIPAINRWNNNNKRKADVSAILQAVSDYRLQNMGNYPTPDSDSSDTGKLDLSSTKRSIYSTRTDIVVSTDTITPANIKNSDSSKVYIYNKRLCDSVNPGGSVIGGSRDIVALYALEPSMPLCRQL